MRRVTAMLNVAAVIVMAAGVAGQEKPSYAGEWKKVAAAGQGEPGVDLIITQSAAAMTVEFPRGDQTPTPLTLTCTLDGSASTSTPAGRGGGAPAGQSSKATWTGNTLVVTTTSGAGEETRTFSMDGGDLVVSTSTPSRDGRTRNVSKATYKRYQRGYGG